MSKTITREEALQRASEQLEISPSKYKQVIDHFESVKNYLLCGEYDGANTDSEIYLQGSFKLGTEIRPYKNSEDADYDIDIVCQLEHDKNKTTPKKVKHQVGDHLKANGRYVNMLNDEGKRCWTLSYAEQDGVGFHMDILPSVKESLNTITNRYCSNPIAATNKCENTGSYNWSSSNPIGFAEWFYDKNKKVFESIKQTRKKTLFESYQKHKIFNSWDEVPDFHVKTPLQRAIQLLKRHRDIRFCNQKNEKCKPISMIITVLAAQVYTDEPTIYETLEKLINTLYEHADQMQSTFRFNEEKAKLNYKLITRTAEGKWYIPNPTNHKENFADKWHESDNGIPHARAMAFFQWVTWAKEDFINIDELLCEKHFTESVLLLGNNSKSLTITESQNLFFNVSHRQKPCWVLKLNYQVTIFAKYKLGDSWKKFNSSEMLNKNLELLFSAKTNIPIPFKVYWQVVNTGKEAEDKKQLRGEIFPSVTAGVGGLTQKESTYYTGNHWIECFIVINNVCVARSGEFIVRIV